ncbi:hypothetical protein VTJ83DRAFT_6773 [Remersonia thermophila]|uniref:Nuc-1 negative regulatory protein preg n=1 Tax=Remersonia thermophila TaxID=72144 RepID=A0ABR4D5N4_9PEZI
MLARSPATSTPTANTSPGRCSQAVHYAPSPKTLRRSSPRVPAVSQSRWQSDEPNPHSARPALTIPAADAPTSTEAIPTRYVAVDAAPNYPPMEPTHHATGDVTRHADTHPAPAASSSPSAASQGRRVTNPAPAPDSETPRTSTPSGPMRRLDPAAAAASPSKRRISQVPGSTTSAPVDAGSSSHAGVAKRPRTAERPTKTLPLRYELCPVPDMVVLIAHMLGELIETNDAIALSSGRLTRFHSRTAPGISVLDYLHRLARHATLTPPLLLSMVYYIDRLCALYPDFTINTLTVHRFLITAATVAAKGLSDAFWNNPTYARVGGVKVAELNVLELEFLRRVDWKIVPNPDVLVAYYQGLVERCPGYALEGQEMGGDAEQDETDLTDEESDEDGGV